MIPIIGDVLDLIGKGVDKIWPDAGEKQKLEISKQQLVNSLQVEMIKLAMDEKKLMFEDTAGARKAYEAELEAKNVPEWARAIQVLGRPFVLYSTVSMYVWAKVAPIFGWPTVVLSDPDYYLVGTIFVFLFGARTIEKLNSKSMA